MKIASITLRDFRRHEESRFELAPVTLWTGPNGAGKSSVAEALRLALSGRTETLNDRNEGIADLVRRGQKQAEIVVELPEGDSIVRRIPGGLSITGTASTTNQKAAETALALMMGGRPDQVRLAMGPRLWKLDDKSRRETLGDVLRLYYTAADVQAALAEQGEVGGLSLVALAREVAGSITNDLAGMEQRAREARRVCKQDLERAQHRLQDLERRVGEGDDQVGDVPAPDATTLQKARLELSRLSGVQQQWEHALAEAQRTESRLQALQDEYAGRTGEPEAVFQEGQQRLALRRRELADAEEVLLALRHAAGEVEAARRELARIEQALQAAGASTCPTCGGPSRQDPEAIRRLQQQHRDLSRRLGCPNPQDLEAASAVVADLRAKVARGEAWVEEQGRLRWLSGSLQELTVRRDDAQARLQSLDRPDEAAYAAAEQRLRDLEQRAAWAREWQGHKKQVDEAKREVEALTRRRDALDRLCGWLGPNGYRLQILQARIEPLVHEVNGLLERWGMAVHYEPGTLDLLVSTARAQDPVPYHLLSDGEQLLVQLAHQAFLATVCGVRILVLDRVEALDKQAQQRLFRACFDLTGPEGTLDHILLMAVDTTTVSYPAGVPQEAFRRYALSTTNGKTERRIA